MEFEIHCIHVFYTPFFNWGPLIFKGKSFLKPYSGAMSATYLKQFLSDVTGDSVNPAFMYPAV